MKNKDKLLEAIFGGLKQELPSDETVEEVLATLSPREQRVIRLRFGLDDGIYRTYEKVGEEIYVTKERIRQIVAKSLRKLRHPSCSRRLGWGYLENNGE